MRRTEIVMVVLASLAIAGCPTRDKYDRLPAVRITSPTATTYTKGPVDIRVAIDDDLDLPVVLRIDGVPIKTLRSPAEAFAWDTTSVLEGPHMLMAEVELSNETLKSNAVTIIVDRQPPTAVLTPLPGAADVRLRSPITIAFSEPVVLPSAVSSIASLSTAGAVVPTTLTVNADNMTVAIAINDLTTLSLPASFSVALLSSITDRAGNELTLPGTWSWTVPDWIRFPAATTQTQPALAVTAASQPILGFTECVPTSNGCGDRLRVATLNGQGWDALEILPDATDTAPGFSLVLDAEDHPVVAFTEFAASTGTAVHVAAWDGTTWNTSIPPIGASGSSSVARAPLVRLAAGNPIVAWRDAKVGGTGVFAALWNGAAWSPFGDIGYSDVNEHDLALGAEGKPLIAYGRTGGGVGATSWDGGRWQERNFTRTAPVSIAVNSNLNALMIDPTFTVVSLTAGGWQPAISTPVPADVAAQQFVLATTPQGDPVVAWINPETPSNRIGLARWTGTRWDTRAGLFRGTGSPLAEQPRLIVDRTGNVWMAWREDFQVNVWMSNY
jgi:hypothetical protein